MTTQEVSSAFKATLYERAKRPFTGTFTLVWLTINWRIIVALFFTSEDSINQQTRITYITSLPEFEIWHLFYWPLIYSAVVLFAVGILNILALKLKSEFTKIEFKWSTKNKPVSAVVHNNLLTKMRTINQTWADNLETLTNSQAELSTKNSELQTEITHKRTELIEMKTEKDQAISQRIAIVKQHDDLLATLKNLDRDNEDLTGRLKEIEEQKLLLQTISKFHSQSNLVNQKQLRKAKEIARKFIDSTSLTSDSEVELAKIIDLKIEDSKYLDEKTIRERLNPYDSKLPKK